MKKTIVPVHNKNGTRHFCLDHREHSAGTIKDSHPHPRVNDTLDAVSDFAWFSTMDLQQGYWQVELVEKGSKKRAFTKGSGLYYFNVKPVLQPHVNA